jgi:predicted DNA-binding transcriptional regulator AlpA
MFHAFCRRRVVSRGEDAVAETVANPTPLLVREKQLPALLGMSRANVRRLLAAGKMPAPIRLGKHCVAWRFSVLEEWVAAGCPAVEGGGDAPRY